MICDDDSGRKMEKHFNMFVCLLLYTHRIGNIESFNIKNNDANVIGEFFVVIDQFIIGFEKFHHQLSYDGDNIKIFD